MRLFNYKSILSGFFVAMALVACDKEEKEITPSELSNLKAEEREGAIKLSWSVDTPENLEYIKVSYFDKLQKKNMVRLVSVHTNSIIIPKTRAKFGAYNFTLQPYSVTKTGGKEYSLVGYSGPAEATYVFDESIDDVAIALSTNNVSTNAQEPSEGPLVSLFDDNYATFFHSRWSGTVPPSPHYLQVDLDQPLRGFKFYFKKRQQNNNNRPTRMTIQGSNNGTDWVDLMVISSGLPTEAATVEYTSPKINASKHTYTKIRFNVNATNNNTTYFSMSEFKLWEVGIKVIDPEDPNLNI